MKTLIELSGSRIAVIEYYIQSTAETFNGLKGDDLVPCRNRIEKVIIINYKMNEATIIEPSDIVKIADEVRLTTAQTINVPVSELI